MARPFKKTLTKSVSITLLAALAVAQLFPLLWIFLYSIQTSGDLFGRELISLPTVPQWQNYARAWVDGRIPRYFANSVIVVFSSVILTTLFAFLVAYSVTRMRWRGRKMVRAFVLLGMVIPIHTTLLPNFMWFKTFSLIDTYAGVIIPYVAFNLAFTTLIFSGILASLPYSLEESAYMDGARLPTILVHIVGPVAKTGFATAAVMTFLTGWNEFIMANTFLASEAKRTLPFSIIRFEGQYRSDYAVQFAVMVVVAIIPIFLYFFFSRWVMTGVTAGSVKE